MQEVVGSPEWAEVKRRLLRREIAVLERCEGRREPMDFLRRRFRPDQIMAGLDRAAKVDPESGCSGSPWSPRRRVTGVSRRLVRSTRPRSNGWTEPQAPSSEPPASGQVFWPGTPPDRDRVRLRGRRTRAARLGRRSGEASRRGRAPAGRVSSRASRGVRRRGDGDVEVKSRCPAQRERCVVPVSASVAALEFRGYE